MDIITNRAPDSHPGADLEIRGRGDNDVLCTIISKSTVAGAPFAVTLISGTLLIDAADKSAAPYSALRAELDTELGKSPAPKKAQKATPAE